MVPDYQYLQWAEYIHGFRDEGRFHIYNIYISLYIHTHSWSLQYNIHTDWREFMTAIKHN